MLAMTGTAIDFGFSAIWAIKGSSQPSLHSMWESRKTNFDFAQARNIGNLLISLSILYFVYCIYKLIFQEIGLKFIFLPFREKLPISCS
jgi:hypothetical protein